MRILSAGAPITADDDRWMQVRVVETGEEIAYRLSQILDDPRER